MKKLIEIQETFLKLSNTNIDEIRALLQSLYFRYTVKFFRRLRNSEEYKIVKDLFLIKDSLEECTNPSLTKSHIKSKKIKGILKKGKFLCNIAYYLMLKYMFHQREGVF